MNNLIKVECDTFFIAKRLKDIDQSYEVYYNLSTQSYEVHSTEQAFNSYCFKVPYPNLDERAIVYAQRTRMANRDKIIAEIERDNYLLEQKNIKKQVEMLKEALC